MEHGGTERLETRGLEYTCGISCCKWESTSGRRVRFLKNRSHKRDREYHKKVTMKAVKEHYDYLYDYKTSGCLPEYDFNCIHDYEDVSIYGNMACGMCNAFESCDCPYNDYWRK